jgi:hypothetical protein
MSDSPLPTATSIVETLQRGDPPSLPSDDGWSGIMDPIRALHRNNTSQWDREDDARNDPEDDFVVASAKRDIDRMNTARHGFIEAIDREIAASIQLREGAPLATESPGMAVDRLSVLLIRLASTEARAASGSADASACAERLPRLRRQLDALEEAIGLLLSDLAGGKRTFVVYESLKLYGEEGPASDG